MVETWPARLQAHGPSQGPLPQVWAGTVRGRWHAGHGATPTDTQSDRSGESGQVAGPAVRAWHSREELTGTPTDERSQDSQREAARTPHICWGDPEEGDIGSPAEHDS